MKGILNLSVGNLEVELVEVISTITTAAEQLDVPFFIIGATARDLILVHGNNAPIERATRDVDFAVCVENWAQYQELQEKLIASGYLKDTRQHQRLLHSNGYVVDIIPFGPISEKGQIAWPPDWDIILSVTGFEDAFESAIQVAFNDRDAKALVANPAGIALLKLISWQERDYSIRPKDAQDLAYLCRYFCQFDDVLTDLYQSRMMERFDYEEAVASGYWLGREVALICSEQTKDDIRALLSKSYDQHGFDRLIAESIESDLPSEKNKTQILEAFKIGFLES